MAFNDDKTYIIPSLLKSAYQACIIIIILRSTGTNTMSCQFQMLTCGLVASPFTESNNSIRGVGILTHSAIGNSCKVQCYAYDSSIEIICQQAAFFGPFDCLMLAREIGVPFNHMYGIPSACSQAETNGQLECLKYLQEN